jgi:hypothetical protein
LQPEARKNFELIFARLIARVPRSLLARADEVIDEAWPTAADGPTENAAMSAVTAAFRRSADEARCKRHRLQANRNRMLIMRVISMHSDNRSG